jgi:hypothetical protein
LSPRSIQKLDSCQISNFEALESSFFFFFWH